MCLMEEQPCAPVVLDETQRYEVPAEFPYDLGVWLGPRADLHS